MTHKELLALMGFHISKTEYGTYACRGDTEIYLYQYRCNTEEDMYEYAVEAVFDKIFNVVGKF